MRTTRTGGITAKEVARIRKRLGMTLMQFAIACRVSINTAWTWEQGINVPNRNHEAQILEVAKQAGIKVE